MNWKAGDIGIFVYSMNHNPQFVGCEVEVVDTRPALDRDLCIRIPGSHSGNKTWPDIWSIYGGQIKPLPPPNELSTWDECVFKPLEFVT